MSNICKRLSQLANQPEMFICLSSKIQYKIANMVDVFELLFSELK